MARRVRLLGVAGAGYFSAAGRMTELGVLLSTSDGKRIPGSAESGRGGVDGKRNFSADASGEVGGVEANPGVVKGLLAGVYGRLDVALLAPASNRERISATGVFGLVMVPILTSLFWWYDFFCAFPSSLLLICNRGAGKLGSASDVMTLRRSSCVSWAGLALDIVASINDKSTGAVGFGF